MKLYMKQKLFTFKDQFTIYDEQGQAAYYVEGEIFTFGKKLHVYDINNHEVAFIQQKVLTFLPRFFVYVENEQVAEIVREFTFFKPKYSIEGLHWSITGDIFQHEYRIDQDEHPIVSIHKAWMRFADTYEIDIKEERATIYALAVVLAIDCVEALEASTQNI